MEAHRPKFLTARRSQARSVYGKTTLAWHAVEPECNAPIFVGSWITNAVVKHQRCTSFVLDAQEVREWASREGLLMLLGLQVLEPAQTGWTLRDVKAVWAEFSAELSWETLVFEDAHGGRFALHTRVVPTCRTAPIWRAK